MLSRFTCVCVHNLRSAFLSCRTCKCAWRGHELKRVQGSGRIKWPVKCRRALSAVRSFFALLKGRQIVDCGIGRQFARFEYLHYRNVLRAFLRNVPSPKDFSLKSVWPRGNKFLSVYIEQVCVGYSEKVRWTMTFECHRLADSLQRIDWSQVCERRCFSVGGSCSQALIQNPGC